MRINLEVDYFQFLEVNAHEVRAVASSLCFKKNSALQEALDAAVWRCNVTFTFFYFCDKEESSNR